MRVMNHDYAGHPFQCDLSRTLAKRGHEVCHVYAASNDAPRGDLERRENDPAGLEFVALHLPRRIQKQAFLERRRLELTYAHMLADRIRSNPPDIVLSGNTPTEVQQILLRAAHEKGVRFVSWVQDIYGVAVHRILRKKLPIIGEIVGRWYIHIDRVVLRKSDAIVVISEDFLHFVDECGVDQNRVRVIYNWAPIQAIPLLPKENPWARENNLVGKTCIIYTGTLGMKHNPALLIDLAKHFRGNDSIQLVIVSQGPGPDWVKEKATEEGLSNIHVTGWVPQQTLPEVLATADVLVAVLEPDAGIFSVPSKVLTYLCAARPMVLAVPLENLAARIVQQVGAGIVVPPNQPRQFIEAVERLLNQPDLGAQMGERGRKYAEENFDIETITDKFEEVFCIAMQQQV
ncbi:MAG TPA: glycosyltransferase family 4 protein [Candidatus Hydrogenedentes bacterium]|nr:glycosyltransferase family 4 protein [Candidatus Hydrogenedentota bacterium]HOL77075.1 glycosyltransferase family 4 protein [Candidatus Hydrogenedentota bacterium]HPO87143.1 glycosyltransferase family 4 protein [Candidatus Hydrogenedentota bacterium]